MPHYGRAKWASGYRPPSVNPESHRRAHLRHRYGIEVEDYDALLARQNGCCAICLQPPGRHENGRWNGKLAIDHCHDRGKVRALLCNDCNLILGRGKTPEILDRAAQYLRDHA